MKIEPVKSYKKPKYAAALAAVTAVGTMSGCIPTGTPGVGPTPVDTTTRRTTAPAGTVTTASDLQISGDVAVITETAGIADISTDNDYDEKINEFRKMYNAEKEKSAYYLNAFKKYGMNLAETSGKIFVDFAEQAFYDETHKLIIAFSSGNVYDRHFEYYMETEYGNFAVSTSYWGTYPGVKNAVSDTRMIAYIDMDKNPVENLDEIAEAIVNDTNNTIKIIYDDEVPLIDMENELQIDGGITVVPDEEVFELAGDVAFVPDEEEETIELSGDVAFVSDEEDNSTETEQNNQ